MYVLDDFRVLYHYSWFDACQNETDEGWPSKRSSASCRSHLADEVQVQLAGGPLSFFPRRNLRLKFLVQGVGFFYQLRGRQRFCEHKHSSRNFFQGVTKLALQIFLHALGMDGAFSAERSQAFIGMFSGHGPV